MNEELFVSHFWDDNIPTWPCPECGANSLSSIEGGFNKQEKFPIDRSHPGFEPDWIKYVFTLNLQCTILKCGCSVVCVGTGEVIWNDALHNNLFRQPWASKFEVKYFQPPLQVFRPPEGTSSNVKEALKTSFSNYFSSPSTSLSTLRAALEVLIGEIEDLPEDKRGKFTSLDKRIRLLPEPYKKIIESAASAVKWLGNDATHPGAPIRKSDVVNGYTIFEHMLEELYPEKKASINPLIERINKSKGVEK